MYEYVLEMIIDPISGIPWLQIALLLCDVTLLAYYSVFKKFPHFVFYFPLADPLEAALSHTAAHDFWWYCSRKLSENGT